MSNKYGSILRTFLSRTIYETTLTPGTDVVIPGTAFLINGRTFPELTRDIHHETNYIVRRLGLFSNFADGLVWKNPADRADVTLNFVAYNFSTEYELSMTYGAKGVTASSGNPGWTPGTRVPIAIFSTTFGPGNYVIMYVDPTGAGAGDLEDYWQGATAASVQAFNLTQVGSDTLHTFKNISLLNCMYEVNEIAEPTKIGGANEYALQAFHVALNFDPEHTTTFLTKSIDASYADDTVYFDIVAEVELTGAV